MSLTADTIIDRYDEACKVKDRHKSMWADVGKYCWPAAQEMYKGIERPVGRIYGIDVYDSTAIIAPYRMTSGIFSYAMPTGGKWFGFKTKRLSDNSNMVYREWLVRAEDALHQEIWRSNFMREMFTAIHSLCVFGTGFISVTKGVRGDLVYRCWPLADMAIEENADGVIDVVYNLSSMTVRQIKQRFGDLPCGKSIDEVKSDPNSLNKKFEILYAVLPRDDYDSSKEDARGKRFASYWVNKADRFIIKESGFKSNPFLVGRFDKSPDEIWGRSPATELIPEIKMLNRMKLTFIQSAEKSANPPIVCDDDGVIGQPVTEANGIIYKRPDAMMPQPLNTGVNVNLNAELILQQQQVIKAGFFNDLFQALAEHQNMTAFEVSKRVEESFGMLAPALSSLQKEMLDPLIMRSLELLIDAGRIDAPPKGLEYDIVYQGRLSLAMNTLQSNAVEIHLAKWAPYLQIKPDIFDNMDLDKAFRHTGLNNGVPVDIFTNERERDIVRQERAALERAAAASQIGAEASKAYRNISKSPEAGSLAMEL